MEIKHGPESRDKWNLWMRLKKTGSVEYWEKHNGNWTIWMNWEI